MERESFKEITEEMVGRDEMICSCTSSVIMMLVSREDRMTPSALKAIVESLRGSDK